MDIKVGDILQNKRYPKTSLKIRILNRLVKNDDTFFIYEEIGGKSPISASSYYIKLFYTKINIKSHKYTDFFVT